MHNVVGPTLVAMAMTFGGARCRDPVAYQRMLVYMFLAYHMCFCMCFVLHCYYYYMRLSVKYRMLQN